MSEVNSTFGHAVLIKEEQEEDGFELRSIPMGQMSEGSSSVNRTRTHRSLSQSHGQNSGRTQQRVIPRSERQRIRLDKHKEEKLDRETRWMFFLNLRHENEGTKEDIIAAVDPDLDPLSYQYEDLWRAIMTKVGHLRSSMMKNLLKQVENEVVFDARRGGDLLELTVHTEIANRFLEIYSRAKFISVFYFVSNIVDMRDLSPLGLYYVKNLYANACARAKTHMDWLGEKDEYLAVKAKCKEQIKRLETRAQNANLFEADENNVVEEEIKVPEFDFNDPRNREALSVYLQNFPQAPQFTRVTRGEFKEIIGKRAKKPKMEDQSRIIVGEDAALFDGPPPAPRPVPATLTTHHLASSAFPAGPVTSSP